jgi:hypothetical protein
MIRRSRQLIFLVVSFVVHATLFSFLLFVRPTPWSLVDKENQPQIIDLFEPFKGERNVAPPAFGRPPRKPQAPSLTQRPLELGVSKRSPKQSKLPSSDGAIPVPNSGASTPQNIPGGSGGSASLQEQVQIAPFLFDIHEKIDSALIMKWEILKGSRSASVTVRLLLNPDGTLQALRDAQGDSMSLRGMALELIKRALKDPLPPSRQINRPIEIACSFFFELFASDILPEPPFPGVVNTQLNFFRYKSAPALLQAHNALNDQGQVVNLRLIALFQAIFGKKAEDPSRVQWDLEMRLNESSSSCESGRAEGACMEAGKIEEAFGRTDKALQRFQAACDLRYELGCREASRLQIRPHKR